jgi:hypothetical protein
MDKKLAVIVPYRNREEHLILFKEHISDYLNKKDIQFELIIVEQSDDKPFNRGKLLNIGFLEAEKLGCNYVVFHDVDMLPIDADYSYSEIPIHLAGNKTTSETYFGGVTIFPIEEFKKINGYPNNYWGWGFEDDELLKRCQITDIKKIRNRKTNSPALRFNGKDCYVMIENNIDFKKDIKFSVVFEVDMVMNESKDYDEWTIFSIPGWDLTLTYNSFGRYKFELWNFKRECFSINSDISLNHLTKIDVEIFIEKKLIRLWQNRELIGELNYKKQLLDYSKEKWIYLGNANPFRGENMKELFGWICDFKVWNDSNLIIDFDFKNCEIYYGCNKEYTKSDLHTNIKIPYRRDCKFKILKHTNEGFLNGKWKNYETRLNQIKYNQGTNKSGLNNLKYKLIEKNSNHIKVKI